MNLKLKLFNQPITNRGCKSPHNKSNHENITTIQHHSKANSLSYVNHRNSYGGIISRTISTIEIMSQQEMYDSLTIDLSTCDHEKLAWFLTHNHPRLSMDLYNAINEYKNK